LPKRSKKARKNSTVQPSDPRLFDAVKPLRVDNISGKVTGSTILRPSSSEKILG
jgi:hypothetical protein